MFGLGLVWPDKLWWADRLYCEVPDPLTGGYCTVLYCVTWAEVEEVEQPGIGKKHYNLYDHDDYSMTKMG